MKTTVEISDALFVAAKKRAAEMRVPLRRLIESGLRRELEEKPRPKRRWKIHTVGRLEDGPPVDISTRDKLRDFIELLPE